MSRDSVRIILTLAALNGLDVLSSDIQNAYLTAPTKEKIWTTCGAEFGGVDSGKRAVIMHALYSTWVRSRFSEPPCQVDVRPWLPFV